jgi:predicted ArsR family transcriptional regulator
MTAHRSTATGVSRGAVLKVLRVAATPVGIDKVAAAVGLSVTTVRFHLDQLVGSGLVTTRRAPVVGPGRPRLLYRAVAAEGVEGAAAYRLLAGLLAAELARSGDPTAAVAAGRAWADRLDLVPVPLTVGTHESATSTAIGHVMDLLDEGGFAPELEQGLDRHRIALHRCPFLDLAVECPEVVCAVHLGLVRGVLDRLRDTQLEAGESAHRLDVPRSKLRPVLDGTGPCLVILPEIPDHPAA